MNLFRRLIILLAALAFPVLALAQSGTSRAIGVVQDRSGANIAGARVTLTKEDTKISQVTTSTSSGNYVFEGIQAGAYSVSVEAEGFKQFVSTGNVLAVGEPMTVNVVLDVGDVRQTVEVSESAELVDTSTSGNVGNLVENAAVVSLPIVGVRGRNVLDFVNFQPGVVNAQNDLAGGGVSVHGSRDRAWNYTLDGIDINEDSAGGSNFSPLRTNPDAISEFRMITSNPTAEFGRNSGAQVMMVTRSGANAFHGNLFEFYQSPFLQANEVANKQAGLRRQQFVQNIYGFSLGGPVIRNKTFFFTNLQMLHTLRTRRQQSIVYTDLARKGIFRFVKGGRNLPAGVTGASVDNNGNVLPGVTVGSFNIGTSDPQGFGLDPAVQKVLALTPLPNDFSSGDGLNEAAFDFSAHEFERQVDFVVKIDHTFNPHHSVFGRWSHGHQNTVADIVNGGLAPFPDAPPVVSTRRTPRNFAFNYRWTPTGRLTNELIAGMNRFGFDFANPDPNFAKNPPFVLNDVTNPRQDYVGNKRTLTTIQLADNLSLARGSHTYKTGINFRYGRHIDTRGSIGSLNASPAIDFDPSVNTVDPATFGIPKDINTTFDQGTAQRTINNLLGRYGTVSQGFVAASDSAYAPAGTLLHFDSRFPEYDSYVQDSWKVKPNLTLDYGVRWEIRLSPRTTRNAILHPNQLAVFGAAPSNTLAWVPGPLYRDQWRNFGPSVGVAWDPYKSGKTVIRANFRLAYDRITTFSLSSGIFQGLPGMTLQVSDQSQGQAGGRLRNGTPTVAPPAGVTPQALRQPAVFSTNSITVADPDLKTPRTYMWSFGMQHELPWKLVAEADYIGHKGSNLYGGYDANQVNIGSNGFLDAFNTVKAGGNSPLINQLLTGDTRLKAGETGSQLVQRLFSSTLNLNSVAALAQSLGQRTRGGKQQITLNGFSPFFFQAYPQFAGAFNVLDSHDFSTYHALEVQLQRRFSGGLLFQLAYTWAKSLDTRSFDPTFSQVRRGSSQSASDTPYNDANRRLNYARSDFDRRNVFQSHYVWELPFGRGRKFGQSWNGVADRLAGGWQVSGIVIWESGHPFTVYSGGNTFTNVVISPASCNNCSPTMGHIQRDPATGVNFLFDANQRAMFFRPPPGQLGNLGRNFFSLPNDFNTDLAVGKTVHLTERTNFELRFEIQNLTNTSQYGFLDSSSITSGVFGRARDAVSNGSRKTQIGAKFNF